MDMDTSMTDPQQELPQQQQSVLKRSRDEVDSDSDTAEVPSPSKRRRSSTSRAASRTTSISIDIPAQNGSSREEGINGHHSGQHELATELAPEPVPEPPKSTPRKRGRPPKNRNGETPTPRGKQRQTPSRTPTKAVVADDDNTPRIPGGADRSARRKSARALIEKVVGDADSDDEEDIDGLAREIYESSEGGDDDDGREEASTVNGDDGKPDGLPDTPSKTPARRGRKRAKSPTPPRDLPPHELYLVQNKPGRPKTSNNTLASLDLLSHEEYFSILGELQDRHKGDIEYLESLHAESFAQWTFELSQGFSICLYGFGSKRSLLRKYARYLHNSWGGSSPNHKIVVVNGYAPTTTMRDVLTTAGLALDQRIPAGAPSTMAHSLLNYLSSTTTDSLTLVINSIDAPPLRRPGHQATIAQLATHPRIHLVCSTDTPDFPLLWDVGIRSAFSFAFHDATTLAPYTVELDVVDDVHELLGRKSRRVNGREGVAFVLRSLPENAKNLFQLLVGEVLIAMEEEAGMGAGEDVGVEYRMVYNKAVEEFICSSEMAFRTLLKEFHDHQIITSKKDALGTELLSVPFRKEELEAILEDLMG